MSHSFVAYIDESGEEGLDGKPGSSEWFVLSAVVTRRETDIEAVKVLDRIRVKLGKQPRKALHFRRLKHDEKLLYLNEFVSEKRLRVLSVLIHKPSLIRGPVFSEDSRLYFYTAKYLLERVSWLCRDVSPGSGDGTVRVVFSSRESMPYHDFRSYLGILKYERSDCRISWNQISPDLVEAQASNKRMGLQLADAVAHSFWRAVDPLNHPATQDTYAKMLKPVVYRRSGVFMSYGIKIWPREALTLVRGEARGEWLRAEYQ